MASDRIWFHPNLTPAKLARSEEQTLTSNLGIVITEIGKDYLCATMPVDARTVQVHGRLNGGASAALAETVGSIGANLTINPETHIAVGLEINANHIRPVKDGFVTATARPEALGKTTQVWSIRITDPKDRLVCLSRLTMAVIPAQRA